MGVSAVADETRLTVNEPDDLTTFLIWAVVSLERITAMMIEVVVAKLFVTVILLCPAAIFTLPEGLLIVCAPVVPDAVKVASKVSFPVNLADPCKSNLNPASVGLEVPQTKLLFSYIFPSTPPELL